MKKEKELTTQAEFLLELAKLYKKWVKVDEVYANAYLTLLNAFSREENKE